MGAAAKNLTPVTLELGGKSPVLMGRTADIGDVARRVMKAKTFNAGQLCHAPDYVLLPKGTEDAFVAFATEAVRDMYGALKENDDYTSIFNERHFKRLRSWIDDAKQKGARVIELNPAGEDFGSSNLHRLPPSLILDVNEEMTVMQDEIFGPLLPIKIYDHIEEAIIYVRNHPSPLALYLLFLTLAPSIGGAEHRKSSTFCGLLLDRKPTHFCRRRSRRSDAANAQTSYRSCS